MYKTLVLGLFRMKTMWPLTGATSNIKCHQVWYHLMIIICDWSNLSTTPMNLLYKTWMLCLIFLILSSPILDIIFTVPESCQEVSSILSGLFKPNSWLFTLYTFFERLISVGNPTQLALTIPHAPIFNLRSSQTNWG